MSTQPGLFTRIVVGFWNGLNWTRRVVMNLLFLAVGLGLLVLIPLFFLALVGSASSAGTASVERGSALVVRPVGQIVEQLSGDPTDRVIEEMLGEGPTETLNSDLLRAISKAKDDSKIDALVIDLNAMAGSGLSKMQALRDAITDFKTSDKPVVAFADFYDKNRYYLASTADEVYIHPMGLLIVEGYGSYGNYYRDAIDKAEADWNIFRVGEYKSAVEPYLRNDMSDKAREARLEWLADLWEAYKVDVATERGLEPQAIENYSNQYHTMLAERGGDTAQLAVDAGLVDHIATRDELKARLIDLVGEANFGDNYKQVDARSYVRGVSKTTGSGSDTVAVVVAKGIILDGEQSPGSVGGDSTARLLERAREDDKVKAVVLRVDSPGGSAFASEVIRRQVDLLREAGKPVVASMGSVAASGGYWISMTADEIWASPTTITGSIGIFGIFPTFQKTLGKVGISTDGVGTGPLAGAFRPDRELPEEAGVVIQQIIEKGYRDFITKAAEGRGVTPEEIDRVARGRVWSGADAHRLGLVDQLGDLDGAIAAAAERAGLGESYKVKTIEKTPTFSEQFVADLFATSTWLHPVIRTLRPSISDLPGGSLLEAAQASGVLDGLERDARLLAQARDPLGVYAYCFCDPQ